MEWSFEDWPEWQAISRAGGAAWLVAYVLFLIYAAGNTSGFLFPDYVNLMIHEAGHLFFSWEGNTLMLLGGTLGELIVPILCAAYFFYKRLPSGFAFASFWFFENFLYIGTYMADARTSALPLVNGDESDWVILFGQWDLLLDDQKIGHTFRAVGWVGMIVVLCWLGYCTWRGQRTDLHPLAD
jgi:hypothetical protein